MKFAALVLSLIFCAPAMAQTPVVGGPASNTSVAQVQTNLAAEIASRTDAINALTTVVNSKISFTGALAYNSATVYPYAVIVTYNGSAYVSIQAGNQGNEPDTATSWWLPLADAPGAASTVQGYLNAEITARANAISAEATARNNQVTGLTPPAIGAAPCSNGASSGVFCANPSMNSCTVNGMTYTLPGDCWLQAAMYWYSQNKKQVELIGDGNVYLISQPIHIPAIGSGTQPGVIMNMHGTRLVAATGSSINHMIYNDVYNSTSSIPVVIRDLVLDPANRYSLSGGTTAGDGAYLTQISGYGGPCLIDNIEVYEGTNYGFGTSPFSVGMTGSTPEQCNALHIQVSGPTYTAGWVSAVVTMSGNTPTLVSGGSGYTAHYVPLQIKGPIGPYTSFQAGMPCNVMPVYWGVVPNWNVAGGGTIASLLQLVSGLNCSANLQTAMPNHNAVQYGAYIAISDGHIENIQTSADAIVGAQGVIGSCAIDGSGNVTLTLSSETGPFAVGEPFQVLPTPSGTGACGANYPTGIGNNVWTLSGVSNTAPYTVTFPTAFGTLTSATATGTAVAEAFGAGVATPVINNEVHDLHPIGTEIGWYNGSERADGENCDNVWALCYNHRKGVGGNTRNITIQNETGASAANYLVGAVVPAVNGFSIENMQCNVAGTGTFTSIVFDAYGDRVGDNNVANYPVALRNQNIFNCGSNPAAQIADNNPGASSAKKACGNQIGTDFYTDCAPTSCVTNEGTFSDQVACSFYQAVDAACLVHQNTYVHLGLQNYSTSAELDQPECNYNSGGNAPFVNMVGAGLGSNAVSGHIMGGTQVTETGSHNHLLYKLGTYNSQGEIKGISFHGGNVVQRTVELHNMQAGSLLDQLNFDGSIATGEGTSHFYVDGETFRIGQLFAGNIYSRDFAPADLAAFAAPTVTSGVPSTPTLLQTCGTSGIGVGTGSSPCGGQYGSAGPIPLILTGSAINSYNMDGAACSDPGSYTSGTMTVLNANVWTITTINVVRAASGCPATVSFSTRDTATNTPHDALIINTTDSRIDMVSTQAGGAPLYAQGTASSCAVTSTTAATLNFSSTVGTFSVGEPITLQSALSGTCGTSGFGNHANFTVASVGTNTIGVTGSGFTVLANTATTGNVVAFEWGCGMRLGAGSYGLVHPIAGGGCGVRWTGAANVQEDRLDSNGAWQEILNGQVQHLKSTRIYAPAYPSGMYGIRDFFMSYGGQYSSFSNGTCNQAQNAGGYSQFTVVYGAEAENFGAPGFPLTIHNMTDCSTSLPVAEQTPNTLLGGISTIASATAITPLTQFLNVTGAVPIATITVSGTAPAVGACLTLFTPSSGSTFTWTSGGNVLNYSTAPVPGVNSQYQACYNGTGYVIK